MKTEQPFNIRRALAAMAMLLPLLTACADYSGSPGGGPQDVLPPVLLTSTPLQGQTDFKSTLITMEFDEFVELREQDKIYTSPVLNKIYYSYALKKVKVEIEDTLRPNYTYTIRFENSLVDLHESNPIRDFHYVFSTGKTVDSGFIEGRVVKAVDYKPEDRVRLLFYNHRPDSFPFNNEPDYVSVGDKEGRFKAIHLQEGCYYIYAVVDEDKNYRINPVTERMAYTDSCIPTKSMKPTLATPTFDTAADDTITTNVSGATVVGTRPVASASADPLRLVAKTDTTVDTTAIAQAIQAEKPLELYLYNDYLPASFLKELVYKQYGRMEIKFYYPIEQPIESVKLITPLDSTEEEMVERPLFVEWQWAEDRRSVVGHLNDYTISQGDVVIQVNGHTDTVPIFLTEYQRKQNTPSQFSLSSASTFLLATDTLKIRTNFPSLNHKFNQKRMAVWHLVSSEKKIRDTLRTVTDTLLQAFDFFPIDTWTWGLKTQTKVGGKYAVFLKDSAVFDFFGRPNDSTLLRWSVNEPEEGGDLALELKGLLPNHIYRLQLVQQSSGRVVLERRIHYTGMVEFLNLHPDQYTFRLYQDDNDNGRWDEGDYVARRQPEKHWYYHKTLRVEADWRIEDKWEIKP